MARVPKTDNNPMLLRIFTGIVLFLSILFLPWWVSAVIAISAVFFFKSYYEIIAAGFLIDALYGAPRAWFFDLSVIGGVFAVVAFFLIQWLKRRIRARQ